LATNSSRQAGGAELLGLPVVAEVGCGFALDGHAANGVGGDLVHGPELVVFQPEHPVGDPLTSLWLAADEAYLDWRVKGDPG
jgi:hypothetical protein